MRLSVWMLPATSRTTNIWKLLEPKSMAAYSEVELILFIVQKAPWSAGRLGPIHITERGARGRSPWQILND